MIRLLNTSIYHQNSSPFLITRSDASFVYSINRNFTNLVLPGDSSLSMRGAIAAVMLLASDEGLLTPHSPSPMFFSDVARTTSGHICSSSLKRLRTPEWLNYDHMREPAAARGQGIPSACLFSYKCRTFSYRCSSSLKTSLIDSTQCVWCILWKKLILLLPPDYVANVLFVTAPSAIHWWERCPPFTC